MMTKQYFIDVFLIGGTAFLVVFLLTPLIRKFALQISALDKPAKRKVHNKLITKLGGVSIFTGFFVSSCLVVILNLGMTPDIKTFLTFLFAVFLVFILGLYDDLKGADAKVKLIVQIIASLILVRMGLVIDKIYFLGILFQLPPVISVLLTIFWLVLITNAVNLIDGIDGLAGGIIFISCFWLFFVLGAHDHFIGLLLLCLGFAHLAFLIYNFPPAKIFMGDCGALTAGFILGGISLLLNRLQYDVIYISIPVFILFIPLLDVFLAVCRRLIKKKYIFQADKSHIHHFLLRKGFSQRNVLYLLYSIAFVMGLTAFIFKTKI